MILLWLFFIAISIRVYRTRVLKNRPDDREVPAPKVKTQRRGCAPARAPSAAQRENAPTPRARTALRAGGTAGGSRPAAPAQPMHRIPGRPLSAPGCRRDRSADRATPTRRCLRADGLGGAPGPAPPPRDGGQGARRGSSAPNPPREGGWVGDCGGIPQGIKSRAPRLGGLGVGGAMPAPGRAQGGAGAGGGCRGAA